MIGVGWVGLCTAACFAELGPRGRGARHPAREGRVALARRGADARARAARAGEQERRAAHLHHRHGRGARPHPAAVLLRGHAAHLLRRRRPLARRGGDRRAGRLRRARDRDEEHRAGGHRPLDPAQARGARVRVEPRVPQGGLGDQGLHAPRPRGGRRRRALRGVRRSRGGALRAARGPDRAHGRRQRGDGEAGVERVPRHQDLVHQRDRERVRGAGRGRERGGARHGPGRPDRRRSSCRRAWASAAAASRRT